MVRPLARSMSDKLPLDGKFGPADWPRNYFPRRRREFVTTETEEKLIASAAISGDKSTSVAG